jgi:hypothetical protein
MKKLYFLFYSTLFLLPHLATAQSTWLPVTARIRETYEKSENGSKSNVEVKEGYFYRSASGSTLIEWVSINNDNSRGGKAELFDNTTGADFSLNTTAKTGMRMPSPNGTQILSPDYLKGASNSKLGTETIEGIVCYKVTSTLLFPDGRKEPAGDACQSPEYGLTLRMDTFAREQNGSVTHRTIRELYDIKLGAEPEAKLFDISSYEIYNFQKGTIAKQ